MPKLPSDIYVGEDIACLIKATDPTKNDEAITNLDCVLQFFEPSLSPKTVPADRATATHTEDLFWDADRQGYYGLVSTSGWTDGVWSYRVLFTGARTNWSFGTVKVKP